MGYIDEEREKIIKELLDSKKVKAGQLINHTQFLELYEQYKDRMSEQNFAEILGITYSNYMNIRNSRRKAKVLKGREERISKKEKNEIMQEVVKRNKIKPGQLIDYKYFKEIYEPYKNKTSEQEFAEILGIRYVNFGSMKNQRHKSKGVKRKQRNNY